MSDEGASCVFDSVRLESNAQLREVQVNYKTFGTLNASGNNALFVAHALTGNAALDSWWGTLLGPGKPFDTDRYFVVCANILGSCYGTTGPASINPATGLQYQGAFPSITIRDTVALHMRLLRHVLGVRQVAAVVGGSLGGMQTLEWAALGQDFVRCIVPIACGAQHTPWQIAFSEAQRQAIYADSNWNGGQYGLQPPLQGLSVARQIAMVSYRTAAAYNMKFGRRVDEDGTMLLFI